MSNEVAGTKLLIYGATGYTGLMICHEAARRGLDFEIAGRNEEKLSALSQQLNVPYHVFSVADKSGWEKSLLEKTCLLNTAGPFSETAEPAMEACIKNQVHYVDIAAEVDIYRLAESKNSAATASGIMILSGAGLFSMYDPLIVHAAKRVKNPVALRSAFQYSGGFTPGSVASSANIIQAGILVRINGLIRQLPVAEPSAFDFGSGPRQCFPTPLGGIVLCYKSTGIPNIEEFFQMALPATKGSDHSTVMDEEINPDSEEPSRILAEVTGADGSVVRSIATMPAGYMPTVTAAIEVVSRELDGSYKAGFQSPASVYGEQLLQSLQVEIIDL
ncbi:saccharopine dehydrogenase NADP-binding domain-containing protein [Dyadobacter sp. UP-52]|uniref:Saccharopine dehydrogenase NADP-binding domain-containing protein n=1 Tax=Dyadobacter subterraneus TaxID=2773304 RepID=A0ABR9WEA1_9BACT|nr:saccharopine dehydrogenase NADP-binding domain-containing protein [Dyadobacter subterraneus]